MLFQAYIEAKNGLGEGPFWEQHSNVLRWVDIVKKKIHTVDLNKGPSSHKVLAENVAAG